MQAGAQLSFRAGARISHRLSPLVESLRPPLLLKTLAARCIGLPSLSPLDTPFRGIDCLIESHESVDDRFEHPRTPTAARYAIQVAARDAVARAVGGARSVGVLVGGGLDSSVVLALAVAIARERGIDAFGVALDFEGPGDDRPHLRALEAKLRCRIVRVQPEDCARQFRFHAGFDRAPFTFANGFFVLEMMQRARDEGAQVVLTGSGGDDHFDGDPRSLSRLLRRGAIVGAIQRARALRGFRRPRFPALEWAFRPILGSLLPSSIRIARARRRSLSRFGARVPAWAGPAIHRFLRARREVLASHVEAAIRADRHTLAAPDPATLGLVFYESWRAALIVGIPRRDPFDDPSLVDLVRSIPPEWLLSSGVRRGLFREAFAELLPSELTWREDKARFEPAFARFLTAVGGADALEHLSDARMLASLGLVERDAFASAFREFITAPAALGWSTLWPALAVEAFLRDEPLAR